jgi:hypothetical protein
LFQKFKKLRFPIEVCPITGAVLCQETDFVNALVNEILDFLQDFGEGERNLFSSDFGDNAECTGIVTSFGNFEVFKALVKVGEGSGNITKKNLIEFISGIKGNLRFEGCSCGVIGEFFPIFHGTSSDTDFFSFIEELVYGLEGFFSSRGNETAGIKKNEFYFGGVGIGGIEEIFIGGSQQFSEEELAINEVFGTSEIDEGDDGWGFCLHWRKYSDLEGRCNEKIPSYYLYLHKSIGI